MKIALSIFLAGMMLLACNQKRAEQVSSISDTSFLVAVKEDSLTSGKDAHYFWQSSFEGKPSRMVMKKVRPLNTDSLTQENMVREINELYADIKINFIKTAHDTIFVRINKGDLLANQMGSGGAETYMAEVTYNLTEVPGINYVCFIFRQGNHATPGIYSRTDFIHP